MAIARPLLFILIATPFGLGSALAADPGPFASFVLPDAWQARFWDDPDTRALLKLDPKALAALVPVQAGLRFARCPNCDADEASDPLIWSATKPAALTCRRCGQSFPNDKIPAKPEGKDKSPPEEAVEVLPGVTHHYPYHVPPAEKRRYEDERIYLDAKRDYETREALSRAALYAATRYHREGTAASKDKLARFAAVLILRFAQVYPAYATHFDQPGQPKFLQRADLGPPYRRGYKTGKWEWTASLDVPLNLVTAYALIRDDPAWAEVGRLLDDPNPKRTIEHGFFRASAEFVRKQPDEFDEMSLQAYRGLFAVARLLGDAPLLDEARGRLARFAERGFFHDGYWRGGDAEAHRRVLQQLDGWIGRLADPGTTDLAMIGLVRRAGSASLVDPRPSDVQLASWPAPSKRSEGRHPVLLGGVGLARLSVGGDKDGLDLELRGMGSPGSLQIARQTLRVAVGGRTVLDDLDDQPPMKDGWDLATASHNTVVVDGLNQRETPMAARKPAGAGQFLYFAADPDFQVVALDDPLAYPRSTTRYRQIALAASGPKSRYAVTVFQVEGGLQHDQVFHGPAAGRSRWAASIPMGAGPESLLPPNLPYIPDVSADDGRWFVQSYGEFRRVAQGRAEGPLTVTLAEPGLRLHILGAMPVDLLTAITPDPTVSKSAATSAEAGEGRASMIVRRRSADGSTLASTFVTVFDPTGAGVPLRRVGRVPSPPGSVVLTVESADGVDHLVVNLRPGTKLTVGSRRWADRDDRWPGAPVRTGGPPTCRWDLREGRARSRSATTVFPVESSDPAGQIDAEGRGWFEVEGPSALFARVEGRTLLIRHGDGSLHGWTITSGRRPEQVPRPARWSVRNPASRSTRPTDEGRYYQFPGITVPGPHTYTISQLSRSSVNHALKINNDIEGIPRSDP